MKRFIIIASLLVASVAAVEAMGVCVTTRNTYLEGNCFVEEIVVCCVDGTGVPRCTVTRQPFLCW